MCGPCVLQMPKLKLLLGAALGIDWEEGQVLTPPEELTDAQAGRYRDYRRAVEKERCMDPLRVRKAGVTFVVLRVIVWVCGSLCVCPSAVELFWLQCYAASTCCIP